MNTFLTIIVVIGVFVVGGRLHSHYLDRCELEMERKWGTVPSWKRRAKNGK